VRYSAFGLVLEANRPLPGLAPSSAERPADALIHLDVPPPPAMGRRRWDPWYASDEAEVPALHAWTLPDGAGFRLRYADGTEFFVDAEGTNVWATWAPSSTLEDTATYLLGPVLGFVLRLRNFACLHACAIAVDGSALVVAGPASAGKSTLAAAFALMGYPVLSDDVVPLVEVYGELHVQPAYPQLRLWPESVAALYGAANALPPLTPTWEKRALDLRRHGGGFHEDALPVAAVYVLAERATERAPRIEPLRGHQLLLTLVANTYVSYLVDGTRHRHELDLLGRLAERVPVRRVVPSADLEQVFALCRCVLDDYATV
jgi:hypothetical protein